MTEESGFLTKGCFAYKPKKKKSSSALSQETCFRGAALDGDNGRWQVFSGLWSKLQADIEDVQTSLTENLLESVARYVATTYDDSSNYGATRTTKEIPTACVIMGVNLPDHATTFEQLSGVVRSSVTPHVARLSPGDVTGVGVALGSIYSQLCQGGESGDREQLVLSEEEEEGFVLSSAARKRSQGITMRHLVSWYHSTLVNDEVETLELTSSPAKKAKKARSSGRTPKKSPRKTQKPSTPESKPIACVGGKRPPILLLLEDFEGTPASVVQDLILMLSGRLSDLPIVLALGVATTAAAVHTSLSQRAASALELRCFRAPLATEHLDKAVARLLLNSESPFRVGGRVLDQLVIRFLHHDFSTSDFARALQVSVMEHFTAQPLSVLCCARAEVKARVASLTKSDLQRVQELDSFRRWLEVQESGDVRKKMKTDAAYLKVRIAEALEGLHDYHARFARALRALHAGGLGLPGNPLGTYTRELYVLCLNKNIVASDEYQSFDKLVRFLSTEELSAVVERLVKSLEEEEVCDEDVWKRGQQLTELVHTMNNLDDPGALVAGAEEEEEADAKLSRPSNLPSRTTMAELKKRLKEMEKCKKKPTKFEAIRTEIADAIQDFAKAELRPASREPLYEALYFSEWSVLRPLLHPSPRLAVETALHTPQAYVTDGKKKKDVGGVIKDLPDLSILYKLHLECGRLINLYDWLQAFAVVLSGGKVGEDEEAEITPEIQARFSQGVSELQFLGFIKSTRRKTDHVQRLTWTR